ncbi:unnamed protein product [Schistosoma curassoni]|uniref:Transmembrane protein 242 n=1 Tax=Schistosoma curassoni TaxID=6186 RepID=A0A183K492_9TREM|nr:unnamed protein product [Schistosoma curassoni]
MRLVTSDENDGGNFKGAVSFACGSFTTFLLAKWWAPDSIS